MPASTIERTHTVVTDVDGTVLSEREDTTTYNVIPASTEPDYVKLYIGAWCEFKGVSGLRPTDKDVLVRLMRVMSYARDGQIIYVNASLKRDIAADLDVSLSAINMAITRLTKTVVLKRIDTAKYQVNPELVGRGNWADIRRLRATFDVIGPDAGRVTVEME